MPGVEDWMNCPLTIIQHLFEQSNGGFSSDPVKEYFSKRLQSEEARSWVPSLNDVALHNLKPNTIVKYRCMIQDMFDPELYLGVYEISDLSSGEDKLVCGKYKDIAECSPQQVINTDSRRNQPMDRQTFYCVPIPGESDWVKLGHTKQNKYDKDTASTRSRLKRPLDDVDDEMGGEKHANINGDDANPMNGDSDNGPVNGSNGINGNQANPVNGNVRCKQPDLNHPLPGETGLTCLVKIYDEIDTFKVNDCVEFIGILSVDPAMAQFENSNSEESLVPEFETPEERQVHSPPPSLVPRLHVLLHTKLQHTNPLVLSDTKHIEFTIKLNQVKTEVSKIREELLSTLEHILLGDKLAAEFFLLHLISRVYGRADVMPLGKLTLNISGCPNSRYYGGLINRFISALVTKCHLLPLTINNMNSMKLIPKKDLKANRLESGILQLSDNTHLVIDETVLEAGQLNPQGVKNITALGNLITWQKVEYDFTFHSQQFQTNVNVLILSEGKSLLPSDFQIPLEKKASPEDIQKHFEELDSKLNEEWLNTLRTYITLTQLIDYTVSEDLQTIIQDDFVNSRKDSPKAMSIEDFHSLLNLLRLQAVSQCQTSPTPDMWNKVKAMEEERKSRLTSTANTTSATS
ncbi:hypothetical protein LOTGIDRAFT_231720 [Lottia gigantea]|uniref:Mini-chromosome maintenance complex-binding protein n=1 Tax=Lottia gigantea TaxID=225164 RepID=V4AT78_LOTGI|nr:hypothetical protein LOTGIDRAFT_231720 [Lottia gigantea]ESO96921.1 hypothetical protein LOTGIDRAFT_231720 [Lottia gigantea]